MSIIPQSIALRDVRPRLSLHLGVDRPDPPITLELLGQPGARSRIATHFRPRPEDVQGWRLIAQRRGLDTDIPTRPRVLLLPPVLRLQQPHTKGRILTPVRALSVSLETPSVEITRLQPILIHSVLDGQSISVLRRMQLVHSEHTGIDVCAKEWITSFALMKRLFRLDLEGDQTPTREHDVSVTVYQHPLPTHCQEFTETCAMARA